MANYHVTKTDSGTWQVLKAGGQRASSLESTQKEAELAAKVLAKNSGGGEVVIHSPNGQIRDSDTVSPANDPNPPKDTKH